MLVTDVLIVTDKVPALLDELAEFDALVETEILATRVFDGSCVREGLELSENCAEVLFDMRGVTVVLGEALVDRENRTLDESRIEADGDVLELFEFRKLIIEETDAVSDAPNETDAFEFVPEMVCVAITVLEIDLTFVCDEKALIVTPDKDACGDIEGEEEDAGDIEPSTADTVPSTDTEGDSRKLSEGTNDIDLNVEAVTDDDDEMRGEREDDTEKVGEGDDDVERVAVLLGKEVELTDGAFVFEKVLHAVIDDDAIPEALYVTVVVTDTETYERDGVILSIDAEGTREILGSADVDGRRWVTVPPMLCVCFHDAV